MVRIISSSNEIMAILQNVVSPIISEELNREFTFIFSTVIDNDKSNYVNYQNKVEVEDNYFNIVYTEEERTAEGLFIRAQCEHVSYDLLSANFTAGFTATGLFSAVATTILAGTGFSIGAVASTATQTISVLEATNARSLLLSWAALHGGEIEWDKYTVNQVVQRGANRGVQFRYRKNLVGVKRITDNRTKVAGLPTISYQASAAELEYEQGYIAAGVNALEHYEVGDTIKVFDEDLNLDVLLRIVKESHDPEQRMQGTVEIANFVDDLTDTLTQIQTTSVSKDSVYNGCSIGPDLGFAATRSDNMARSIMNATDGIKIQKGDGTGSNWTDVIYLDVSGNATFSGFILASQIIGGSIVIGTGSNTFNANGTNGIWLGATAFATAPFRVSLAGLAEATGLLVTSGSITGSVIQSAVTGARTVIENDSIKFYDSANTLSMEIPKMTDANLEKRIVFYKSGAVWGSLQTFAAGNAMELQGPPATSGTTTLIQLKDDGTILFAGNELDLSGIAVTGLDTNTTGSHNHGGAVSSDGGHSHTVG
jgi:hypothetical protein